MSIALAVGTALLFPVVVVHAVVYVRAWKAPMADGRRGRYHAGPRR